MKMVFYKNNNNANRSSNNQTISDLKKVIGVNAVKWEVQLAKAKPATFEVLREEWRRDLRYKDQPCSIVAFAVVVCLGRQKIQWTRYNNYDYILRLLFSFIVQTGNWRFLAVDASFHTTT